MRLVLFATNANPYLCALLKSALLHAVEVNIIGWNLRPAAGQAINQVISEMNARWACAEPRQSIVMGLDAFDTMFTPKPVSARSLRDHLAERGADFVWSAESNMFPAFSEFAPGFEESYPAGSPTRYKYLNYGGWVGTAAAACRVMQTCSQQMKNCTHCREAAQAGKTGWAWFDQHAAQYALVRLKGGARQVLDNRNEMFHSGWLDCSDFNTTSYRLRSSGVAPHVLHLNGDAKRFCGAAVFSEAWFVNRTTLPTWHITLSEGKLTRSVHVNDICPSILQPAVMAAELEGWYASTRAKAEKRMASTTHTPHRHTVKETLSAATVTCHKAPIRACAGSVMGAANGHFNCSDARVRCSAAPWCAGIHHVYPWCHAMTCLHVEDRLGHCVELVRTSARPAQRAASPWTQRGDPSCARVRLLLQGWGLGDRAELACASFQWGHATLEHLFRVDSPSPYGWYRLRALHFVRELARQPVLRKSTGAAVLITEDDATLPPVVVAALRQAGTPLLAHSIKRASKVGAILIPDWHFIEARGFQAIVAERSRRHLDKREPKLFWRGSTTGEPGALPDDGPTSPTARANTGTCCDSLLRVRLVRLLRNTAWADVKLSQALDHCRGHTERLRAEGLMAGKEPEGKWGAFRGLLDVDGHVNAWGLYWRLASGSAVFRVESELTNAYIEQMKPFVHYLPIASNLSNLLPLTALVASERREDTQLLERLARAGWNLSRKFTWKNELSRVAVELKAVLQCCVNGPSHEGGEPRVGLFRFI